MASLDSTTIGNLKALEAGVSKWGRDALTSPDLALKRGERMVQRELDKWFPTKESLLEALANAYERVDITQVDLTEQGVLRFVGGSPLALRFWERMKEAERLRPSSPLLLIFEPTSFGQAKVRSLSALHMARSFEGTAEQKAITALNALRRIVDELYTPYLIRLDRLGAILAGQKVQVDPKPGKLAERWSKRFGDPQILDRDLVRVRNAAAHSHFRYLGHRRIHLWNDSEERWSWDGRTGDLLELAGRTVDTVEAFEKATQLYALKFMLGLLQPALPHMAPLIRGQLSEGQVAEISGAYIAKERSLLGTLSETKNLLGLAQEEDLARRGRHQRLPAS